LARAAPALSARQVMTRGQCVGFAIAVAAVAAWLCISPMTFAAALVVFMSLSFVVGALFRALLALFGARPAGQEDSPDTDGMLPLYTILVPLYREAGMLPELVRSLLALDYPSDRLDIKLVVEADDTETVAQAEALAPQGPFEVIAVPPSLPRTKPKAANFALPFARGDLLVIYDAEDRPEPDQLRKAVARFRRLPRKTACLQARLRFYNANDNWLTRLFDLDYALWFNVLLPGLDRLGVPMPLGGTSNHFRISVLRAIGGWDPFNVTEDADIGIRLAELGYRVSMLDSTTFEEAPSELDAWLRQRSRWLKGYMQTWLVHGRGSLIGRSGFGGFLALQLFIGGAVLSALVNPLLWTIFVLSNFYAIPMFAGFPEHGLVFVSGAGLIGANGLLTYLAMIGPRRRGGPALSPYGLTVTIYWALISVAAYRGLWQLVTKPFFWEKTPHGLNRRTSETPDA